MIEKIITKILNKLCKNKANTYVLAGIFIAIYIYLLFTVSNDHNLIISLFKGFLILVLTFLIPLMLFRAEKLKK
jgi:hypothetical protein